MAVGVVTTSLSLAVTLLDALTGEILADPASDVRISFPGLDVEPTPHRSGYYLFVDLGVDAVTVAVDGGETYRDEERTISLDGAAVVVDVRLLAHGPTFVRGVVSDPGGEPPPAWVSRCPRSMGPPNRTGTGSSQWRFATSRST